MPAYSLQPLIFISGKRKIPAMTGLKQRVRCGNIFPRLLNPGILLNQFIYDRARPLSEIRDA